MIDAGGTVMTRADNPQQRLFRNSTTGASVFDANQFEYDWTGGFEVGARYKIDRCRTLELRYFQINDIDAQGVFFVPTAEDLIVENTGQDLIGNLGGDMAGAVSASTDVLSFESNLRRRQNEVTDLFFGFRFAQIRDEFNTFIDVPAIPFTNDITFDADNHLYGLQIGAESVLYDNSSRGVRLDSILKGGVYINDIDVDMVNIQSGALFGNASDSATSFASLLEANLGATWQLTPNISFRCGYQSTLFTGVALATEQLSGNSSVFNPATVNADDDEVLFLHGATFNLRLRL